MWKKLISLTLALVLFLTSAPLAMAGSLIDTIMEEIEAIQKALDAGELTEEEALELMGLLGEEGKAALPTPENVRADATSYNSVTLTWDAVAGAEYYNVHRSMNVSGPFTVIQSNVNGTTYTDSDTVVCGSTYYYRVVARNSVGDSSSFSAIVPVVVTPDIPHLVKAEVLSSTSVQLTWQEAQGASGYYIYRTVTGVNSYQLIATISNSATTTYTDSTMTTGVSYSYRMQSFTGTVNSDYSNVLSVVALPATPANVKVKSSAYNTIIISWDAVEGATGYKLQRSADESGTGNYVDLGETTSTSYADTGLHPGVRYWYKVAAVVNGVTSDYSAPGNDYPRPEAVTGVSATAISDTTVRLSWSLNMNAGYQGYWIEQWDAGTSTWTRPYPKIVGVNTTTYDIAGLTTGQIYYFRIVAYTLMSDSTWEVDGDPSGQVSVIPKPSSPENLKVENAGLSSLKLSWDRVATATGYEIYQSTSATGNFVMIADVPVSGEAREWYNAINLKAGTTYYFRVVAYVIVTPPTKVYSGYSGIADGMPAPLAPSFLTVNVTDYQSVYLNWAAVQGAEGYDILVATSPEGAYDIAATAPADATGYGLSGLSIGTTYYFMVRAYVTVNGVHVPGTPTAPQTVQIMPATVVWDPKLTGPYTISVDHIGWEPVPGATSYQVEWSEDGSNFTLATSVTGNEAFITVTAGKTMYFRVRAVVTSGSATYYGEYSIVWGIEPKPATTSISAATPQGLTDILVTWETSADIASLDGGYYVYMGTTPDIASMTQIAQLNRTDMNSYWHNGVTPGVNYYYAIQSYALTDYGLRTSDYSEVVGCYTRLAAPHDLVVFGNDASSFTLTWAAGDNNADSYEIFSATSQNGTYTKVGETTGLQYTTPNQFAFGTVYYFKVRAKLTTGSVITYSDYSEVVAASPTLAAPTNVKVTIKSSTSVLVSWDAVKDADGYYVYMSTTSDGTATRVATTNASTLTATISKLTVGQTYYFRVAAYHTWRRTQYEGARSSEVSTITSLLAPVANGETLSKSSVRLTWTAVSGATSYRIYWRPYGTTDPLTLLADGVTRTNYTVTDLPTNVWYVFEIVPCTTLGGNVVEGVHSNSVVMFASVLAPKTIKVTHGEGTIAHVTWSGVADASGYYLEVSDQVNADPYTQLLTMDSGDTLSATVDMSTLGFTTTAYFRVRAFYRDPSTMQVYPSGYTSNVASLDTVPDAPASFFVYQSGIGTAHLSWNSVANANGYFIFMKTAADTSYTVIAQVGMINTYEVGGLSAGVQYNFAIRAFRTTGDNYTFGLYAHALPNPLMINANPQPLTAPAGLSVSQGTGYSAVVKWNAVANATGYRVYMSKDGGPYDMVAETNKLTATIPNLQVGSSYNFRVSAYTTNASGSQEGPVQTTPANLVIAGPSTLAAPNGLHVSQTGNTEAKVTWEAVSGAVGYYVFLSEKNANSFKPVGSTTALNYTLTGLKVGTQYYVTVRAYTYYGGSTVYGSYPTPVSLMLSTGTLEIMSVDYIVSEDAKSFKVTRPTVKGGTGVYTYTYYLWSSTGTLAGTVASNDTVVTISPTPGMNGTYSVGVNVFDGYNNAVKQGDWLMLVGYSSSSLSMTLGAFSLSPDGQSMYIDQPTVTGGSGLKCTYAYNLYDDAGHAINYFYSDETRVAMTPGAPGHYNVFVVVTDTGTGEQVVKDIGWFDIT